MNIDVELLHLDEPNRLLWSRANFEEAMPGVLTPLSWSFWGPANQRVTRAVYVERFGAFSRSELTDAVEDELTGLFYGRAAVNVDLLRRALDRVPGADPDALELQILGSVRADAVSHPTWRRVPAVLARAPYHVARLPRRIRRLRASIDAWWRAATASEPANVRAAGALMRDAQERFVAAATEHGFNVFVGQAAYDRLAKLAARTGCAGLELALAASGDGTEETAMVDDLRAVAGGRSTVERFLGDHGYHGPDEGQISSWSWREDPAPLLALLERYLAIGDERGGTVARSRALALDQLLAACSPRQRVEARLVLALADRHLPLREVGKAAFLQCIDVARHGAHSAGRLLVGQGRLEAVDDVAFLTLDELVGDRFDEGAVERRRRRREELLGLEVPDSFVGVPEARPAAGVAADEGGHAVVAGVAASPGRHRGRARVVRDPSDCDRVEVGDVLVCELTDPGWAPLLAISGAAVIDIGGPLSHGAIVARELGIPCVIGTGDGTRRIPDGAVVEVDGSAGTATVVA